MTSLIYKVVQHCCVIVLLLFFADYINQDRFHLPSRATLVIAPNHLTEQWSEEIKTHTDLSTIVIVSKPRWDTVRDVILF